MNICSDMLARKRGFTLIEILIVIAIIAFLVVILVAAINVITVEEVEARRAIANLGDAIDAYTNRYGAPPPSDMPNGYPDSSGVDTGAQCLYYFLTGPEEQGWTTEHDIAPHYVISPVNVRDDWVGGGPGTDVRRKYFTDGLGDGETPKAILYYRASSERNKWTVEDVYDQADNSHGGEDSPFWSPSAEQFRNLVSKTDDRGRPTGAPHNPDGYLLISPGPDRKFGIELGQTDDVTNF